MQIRTLTHGRDEHVSARILPGFHRRCRTLARLRSLCTLKNDVILVRHEGDVLPGDQMAPARTPAADISASLSSGSFEHAFPNYTIPSPSLTLTRQEIPSETLFSMARQRSLLAVERKLGSLASLICESSTHL